MHLKTFTAATTAEAMNLVRRELGEDAAIVSTRRASNGEGAHVIVAHHETRGNGRTAAAPNIPAATTAANVPGSSRLEIYETVRRTLLRHGAPEGLTKRLAHAAAAFAAGDPEAALSAAMEAEFRFAPIPPPKDPRPLILVGPPGAGKTLTTAKLAAAAVMAGHSPGVVATDLKRAGGVEQLAAFARILELDLETARTPGELGDVVSRLGCRDAVYIDSAAVNPFDDAEMDVLSEWISAAGAEALAVLPAGGDPEETADMAARFAAAGARGVIITRLDVTRRLGGVLAAADETGLVFSGAGVTSQVAGGLVPIDPVSLARLIMPAAVGARDDRLKAGAAS